MWAFIRPLLPHIAIAAAILFAIWRIDQNGYNRAKDQAEKAELERKNMELRLNAKIETAIGEGLDQIETTARTAISEIDVTERTVVMPTITKEIRSDPRYTDPAAGISDGLLDSLNRARGASHPKARAGNQ